MTTFLNTPLEERSILDVPDLLNNIRSILEDLDKHELQLNPVIYRQLARQATLIQEGLVDIQDNWDGTRVEYDAVERTWRYNKPTGQYRLNLDLDEMIRLSRIGMAEEEIAQALGCSRTTLWARKKELGIGKQLFTAILDEDLECVGLPHKKLSPAA